MKTLLEKIKEEVALMNGYEDWNEMIFASRHPNLLDDIYNEISKHYAKEVAKQALKNASSSLIKHYFIDNSDIAIDSKEIEKIINCENNIPEI